MRAEIPSSSEYKRHQHGVEKKVPVLLGCEPRACNDSMCVMVFATLVALKVQAMIVRSSAVEPAVIPTFTESPLVIVSVCGVESENAPVDPEPTVNVLLPLAPLCESYS